MILIKNCVVCESSFETKAYNKRTCSVACRLQHRKNRTGIRFAKNSPKKIVIEYNGDFWHCNPYKYKENYYNPKKQLFAKQIWDLDYKRIKAIEDKGYKVIIIWENDFLKNRNQTIDFAMKEIRNNNGI